MTNAEKVLILVPAYSALGGIKNYYKTLKGLFTIPVLYQYRGGRNQPFRGGFFTEGRRIIHDISEYIKHLQSKRILLVHLNTSLSLASVLRDGIYILLAKFYKVKFIVFFRGWSDETVLAIEKHYLSLFRYVFFKSEAIITLSTKSKKTLLNWGYYREIYLETTLVDDNLLSDFTLDMRISKQAKSEFVILFLARLQKEKGIYELLQAFNMLSIKYPSMRLIIAGSGTEENNLKKTIKGNKIVMTGHIEGKEKAEVYLSSDLYVLPSYTEGMPNSVLEAMAFALPVICTPVGALSEIILDGENGIITEEADSQLIAEAIEKLYLNADLRTRISQLNYSFAQQFYSTEVVKRLEGIYQKVLHENSEL
jgi:glycosyltransferase involved in cell wall biosynthesis